MWNKRPLSFESTHKIIDVGLIGGCGCDDMRLLQCIDCGIFLFPVNSNNLLFCYADERVEHNVKIISPIKAVSCEEFLLRQALE